MKIQVNETLTLSLLNEGDAETVFNMVGENRAYLRTWLPFVDRMQTLDFAENFIKGALQRKEAGLDYAFLILEKEKAVGRVGVYKIDSQNKIGEIGYWIVESAQGKGIVTNACERLIAFCFQDLGLNRVEIRCGTENSKSRKIPENLAFVKEGILRQGELLHGQFIDLNLYSLLKSDWEKQKNKDEF